VFVLLARYRVADLDRFLGVFEHFDDLRRDSGSTGHRLLGASDDPTRVVALITFGSRAAAESFAGGAARHAALIEAGVRERIDEILEEIPS